MKKRKLGKSGLEVAPLAFGGNVFGWTTDEATSFALLDAFVDAGFDLIDTADVYSAWVPGHKGGESEAIIGKWLKSRGGRDRVVIATKVGLGDGDFGKGLSKAHVVKSRRGLARPAADRLHRPLPVAHRRCRDAVRGDAGRLCQADRAGQGAGDRRLQPYRAAPGRSARR